MAIHNLEAVHEALKDMRSVYEHANDLYELNQDDAMKEANTTNTKERSCASSCASDDSYYSEISVARAARRARIAREVSEVSVAATESSPIASTFTPHALYASHIPRRLPRRGDQ